MALQKVKRSAPQKVVKRVTESATSKPRGREYTPSIGRRKVSTARVRMYTGKGESQVNGKPSLAYFFSVDPTGVLFNRAFAAADVQDRFHATVKVEGSGLRSQLDAVVMGIARALVARDEAYRPSLRKAGLLTRDSRMKQSRQIGRGGKARRSKQSPKR